MQYLVDVVLVCGVSGGHIGSLRIAIEPVIVYTVGTIQCGVGCPREAPAGSCSYILHYTTRLRPTELSTRADVRREGPAPRLVGISLTSLRKFHGLGTCTFVRAGIWQELYRKRDLRNAVTK